MTSTTTTTTTVTHLEDPWSTIHANQGCGDLKNCYRVDGAFDLMFHRSQSRKKGMQSKIPSLSIGDVRQSFVQLRMMAPNVNSDTMLFSGMTAGRFALLYIIKTYKGAKNRRRKNLCANQTTTTHPESENGEGAAHDPHSSGLHGHPDGRPGGVRRGEELLQGYTPWIHKEAFFQEQGGVCPVEAEGVH